MNGINGKKKENGMNGKKGKNENRLKNVVKNAIVGVDVYMVMHTKENDLPS